MELTDNDRKLLKSWGNKPVEVAQIAHVAFFTTYKCCKTFMNEKKNVTCGKREDISETEALRKLGRERFLQGLCRSAFHWTATCETDDGELVEFDSKRYFRNN